MKCTKNGFLEPFFMVFLIHTLMEYFLYFLCFVTLSWKTILPYFWTPIPIESGQTAFPLKPHWMYKI